VAAPQRLARRGALVGPAHRRTQLGQRAGAVEAYRGAVEHADSVGQQVEPLTPLFQQSLGS